MWYIITEDVCPHNNHTGVYCMKKIALTLVVVTAMALVFAGCGSKPAPAPESNGQPAWVRELRRNAPEDVLVGIGQAKLATPNQSMNASETRARAQIVRAMDSMVKNMIEDYTASSEVDTSAAISFQQEVTVALGKAQLTGAVIKDQDSDPSGIWWTVIYLSKADVTREISQAQAAARLAVPAAAAFIAEERMEEKFRQAAQEEWVSNF